MKAAIMRFRESRWTGYVLPLFFLLALTLLFAVWTKGRFLDERNLTSMIKQSLVIAVIATGAVFIFATKNVNLAMGSTAQLTVTLAMLLFMRAEYPTWLLVVSAVVIGVAIMLVCAFLSTTLKVRVMYVTLVMMVLLSALQNEIISGTEKSLPYAVTKALQSSSLFYVLFIVFLVASFVVFNLTPLGKKLRFIGSNGVCAEYTGYRMRKYLVIAFIIAGVGIGIGSAMTVIRSGFVSSDTCSGMNMDVMLAIVLGGMPISGGSRSKVESGLIGALTVTVLNTGLLMVGVSNTLIQGVRGVLFLLLIIAAGMGSRSDK